MSLTQKAKTEVLGGTHHGEYSVLMRRVEQGVMMYGGRDAATGAAGAAGLSR